KMCVRSFLALEVGVHGGCKREGHDGVVANDLAALPRVPPVVESMIELLLRCARLDQPSEHLRLVLVGRGIRPVAARPNVAYRHGHAERIGKRHILPTVVRGRYAYVVGDLFLEDAIAVFGGEAQECDRSTQRLRHRKDPVPHVSAVGVGARARMAVLRVYDAVNDKSADANLVRDSAAVESVERRAWCSDGQSGPRLDRTL